MYRKFFFFFINFSFFFFTAFIQYIYYAQCFNKFIRFIRTHKFMRNDAPRADCNWTTYKTLPDEFLVIIFRGGTLSEQLLFEQKSYLVSEYNFNFARVCVINARFF